MPKIARAVYPCILLCCGILTAGSAFAARPAAGIVPVHDPPPEPNLRFMTGMVSLSDPGPPAQCHFDRGTAKIETAGERAANLAGRTLNTVSSEPGANLIVGPIAFLATPVAAAVGALGAGGKMSAAQLSEAEKDLVEAFEDTAAQERFRIIFLNTVKAASAHSLLLPGTASTAQPDSELEVRVEELRLSKMNQSEDSYALTIRARARLSRIADHAVLLERVTEYRSGTSLFVDWTRHQALQSVADTGYRKLAQRIFEETLSLSDGPLLAGPGHKQSPRKTAPPLAFARTTPTPEARPASAPGFQRVSQRLSNLETLGVFSFADSPHVAYQSPVERDQEYLESIERTERQLDGLHNHPNPVVYLATDLAAIPMSLWNQGAALAGSLSKSKARQVDEALRKATIAAMPHQELAFQVAEHLTPRTDQPVVLVRNTGDLRLGAKPELSAATGKAIPAARRDNDPARVSDPTSATTALQVRLLSAALVPTDSASHSQALKVEVLATLVRVSDGRPLYSCPVNYRSKTHKLTRWAEDDARLLRRELKDCYWTLGRMLSDHLVDRGIIAPGQATQAAFAGN